MRLRWALLNSLIKVESETEVTLSRDSFIGLGLNGLGLKAPQLSP